MSEYFCKDSTCCSKWETSQFFDYHDLRPQPPDEPKSSTKLKPNLTIDWNVHSRTHFNIWRLDIFLKVITQLESDTLLPLHMPRPFSIYRVQKRPHNLACGREPELASSRHFHHSPAKLKTFLTLPLHSGAIHRPSSSLWHHAPSPKSLSLYIARGERSLLKQKAIFHYCLQSWRDPWVKIGSVEAVVEGLLGIVTWVEV